MALLFLFWVGFLAFIVFLFKLHDDWSHDDPAKADALMLIALLLLGGIIVAGASHFQEPGHDYEVYFDD